MWCVPACAVALYLRGETEVANIAVKVVRLQLLLRLLRNGLRHFGGRRAVRDFLLRSGLLVLLTPLVEEQARPLVVELAIVMHPEN